MAPNECIAMILAGGQGSRLGVLTRHIAKPAVPFGGKYRIIDFTLSNCVNSGIDTVGVLTQYQPLELNTYVGSGQPWDLDRHHGGVLVLPPFLRSEVGEWYKGTANAIFQNFPYISQFQPKYVLILSGDHIYSMDYAKMLREHIAAQAATTIAVIDVDIAEASRFGIMNVDDTGRIIEFEEKPAQPKSTLASMGIYIFTWEKLKHYLSADEKDLDSSHDFGKNIIPTMLAEGEKMQSYVFEGYWRDVGTIESLWEANMDLLKNPPTFHLNGDWRFYSRNPVQPPHYISSTAQVKNSMITEGCDIYGGVEHSVLFHGVQVFHDAIVKDSILMPGVRIGHGAVVEKAIVGSGTVIGEGAIIGRHYKEDNPYASEYCTQGISAIGDNLYIGKNTEIYQGSMIGEDLVEPSGAYPVADSDDNTPKEETYHV